MNLKESLVLMFKYYEKNDTQLLELYLRRLKQFDKETVCRRIEYLIDNSKWMPKIAEIIEPLGTKIETQMEKDWAVFVKTMNNNFKFEPIPDWVLTIKEHIGVKRCENILEDELHWLKREYEKTYPLVKNGTIGMKHDCNKYLKVGNSTVKMDNSFDMTNRPLLAERIRSEKNLIECESKNK